MSTAEPQSAAEAGARDRHVPTVAVLVPAQHLRDGAGAAAVFRQEIEAIHAAGARSVLVVLAPDLRIGRAARHRRHAALADAAATLGAGATIVLARRLAWSRIADVGAIVAARRRGWTLACDLAAGRLTDTHGLARRVRPDLVIGNYLTSLPAADALAPRDRQLLVLHDVPAGELGPPVVAALRGRPHAVALSAADARLIETRVPGTACVAATPVPNVRPLADGDVQRFAQLGALLDASGPARAPAGGWMASDWRHARSLDLLFVGGMHAPNRVGLAQFVARCFTPQLAGRGIRLVVAGEVGPALWPGGHGPAGVTVLGRVADLRGLYAAARLVIAPLSSGSGVSLKTLEAIAHGKPVLATAIGLRGLDGAAELAAPSDPALAWAERIVELLADAGRRRRLRDALRAALPRGTLAGTVIEAVQRATGLRDAPGDRESQPASSRPLVEWSRP